MRFLSAFAKFSLFQTKKPFFVYQKDLEYIYWLFFYSFVLAKIRLLKKKLTGLNVLLMVDFAFKSNCKQQVIFHLNNGRQPYVRDIVTQKFHRRKKAFSEIMNYHKEVKYMETRALIFKMFQ